MDLQQVIEQFRAACNDFARGEPEPIKAIYSHADDATLANPFGPPVRGWEKVSQLLDYASSRFRDGEVTKWERIAEYATPDLVTMLEMERWVMKVGGREQAASIDLRVTSTFRREDGAWKLVSRHADPISTFDSDGPMRAMGG